MLTRSLHRIFQPNRIAVIGASDRPGSVGNTLLRNLFASGFDGVIYPVNPKRESVLGIATWPSIGTVPHPPDLALVCTPAATVPGIVSECGAAGVGGMIVLSAGFRESGADGRALEQQVAAAARPHGDLRIIGPNCLGVIVPRLKLNASFGMGMPQPGRVAFLSQSGALCTSVLDWALQENVGFSHFVSIGNMLDVGFADLIDYIATDPGTDAILLYVESITGARDFMSAARAFSRTKPIIAYKAGRFAESARAAASHTGALAGEDAVYNAAFERAGIERVFTIKDMFDCAELLARQHRPRGRRLAILTNAGGPGVMATDALLARGGELATLSEQTIAQLNVHLPPYWSHGNPVDLLGDAPPERFAEATSIVLADSAVDALLLILTPQAMTDPTATAAAVAAAAGCCANKPVLTSWMGGGSVAAGIDRLNKAGLPTYASPEQAVDAFMHLVSYARNRDILYETPRELPVVFAAPHDELRRSTASLFSGSEPILSEADSKDLLAAYGIPVVETRTARTADEAVEAARRCGYPAVLKVWSPGITHKSDVGGVKLGLADDDAVRRAFEEIASSVRSAHPQADVLGVTVQPMIVRPKAVELILGARKDAVFGAVILAGAGGTAAEIFRDRSLGLPPLNERLARRLLESLRVWPLLQGYRGAPAADINRLIEILVRLSYLVANHPEVGELDMNPVLASPEGVLVLDARVVVDRQVSAEAEPYAHLAIRPYPDELASEVRLRDGAAVLLRPIRPEDEPRWHELLAVCSRESIRSRFQYLFQATTHEMATRYCFIDYDRELAIVAEADGPQGTRSLAGVGRLVSDSGRESAEFAILVADPWQGRGLGWELTRYCLDVAQRSGLREVHAETTIDNSRMTRLFEEHGFELAYDYSSGRVTAAKRL